MNWKMILPAFLIAACVPAKASEIELSEPLALNPDLTLASLLPSAVHEATDDPFRKQVDRLKNTVGEPFRATFDIMLPDYPNVSVSLLVSEETNVVQLIERVFSIAQAGSMPGGGAADRDFPDGFDCVGDVSGMLISCLFGSAGVQFSAYDFLEKGSIDYATAKSIFLTLPTDIYEKLFAS